MPAPERDMGVVAAVHRGFAQVAPAADCEFRYEFTGFFVFQAFGAPARVWVAVGCDLLELMLASVAKVFEKSHTVKL